MCNLEWPQFKRFIELYYGDPDYHELYEQDPESALKNKDLFLKKKYLKDAKFIFDINKITDIEYKNNPYISDYNDRISYVHTLVNERSHPAHIPNIRLRKWTQRQKNRLNFVSKVKHNSFVPIPIAFELSYGCSIQCPFCCFDPPLLQKVFRYDHENSQLWNEILNKCIGIIGSPVQSGVCYHATEPLDNPDYEKFIIDFHSIIGTWPQTTTAAFLKDKERIKHLIELISPDGIKSAALRCSVSSLKQLREVHSSFSANQLQFIELLLNNPESYYHYSLSGRARKYAETLPKEMFIPGTTSECVSGFVVNMANKTVSLITPEPANEKYPLGHDLYETVKFDDADNFEETLLYLIEKWMPTEIPENRILRFQDHITTIREEGKLTIKGEGVSRRISCSDGLSSIVEYINNGSFSIREIINKLGIGEGEMLFLRPKLEQLNSFGYFQEHIQ